MSQFIERIFVATTAHIPESVCRSLNADYASMSSDYGFMLHVHKEARWNDLHKNLRQLAKIARRQNCQWLLLGCDADQHPEVSVFDW